MGTHVFFFPTFSGYPPDGASGSCSTKAHASWVFPLFLACGGSWERLSLLRRTVGVAAYSGGSPRRDQGRDRRWWVWGRSILLERSRTRTCSKGGVGGACRVLVAALPSGATSLSSGSPVQGLAAVATVSLSLLVLLCSISRACVVSTFFSFLKNLFCDVTLC